MTDIKEEVKNTDTANTDTKVAEKPKTGRKKPAKVPVSAEKAETSFEFSDKDVQEFQQWKKDKEIKETADFTCGSADDDKVYRKWKEESRLVKGVFRCREPEGGSVKFAFRKYKWDQTQWYTMFDGEVYEVPLAVARHLNKNCNYPIHSHILGPDGNPTVDRAGKTKSRMNFESTEFAIA